MDIDETFCIALDREVERKRLISEDFEREGMDVTFFRAIDGRAPLSAEHRAMLNPVLYRVAHPSVLGCALSHMDLWHHLQTRPGNLFLVFESDARLESNFKDHLQQCLNETDEPFDVLFIGNKDFDPLNNTIVRKAYAKLIYSGKKVQRLSRTRYIPDVTLGAHAYVVTKAGAAKLLEKAKEKMGQHIDLVMQNIRGIMVQSVYPSLVAQRGDDTSMTSIRHFPRSLNTIMNKKRENSFTFMYYMSCPVAQICGQPINGWTAVFVALGLTILVNKSPLVLVFALLIFLFLLDTVVMMWSFDAEPDMDAYYFAWISFLILLPTIFYKLGKGLLK